MIAHTGNCPRYRIVLRGECRQLLFGVPGEFSVESRGGRTYVIASVCDDSELYCLLDQFEEFALHIVSVDELRAGTMSPLSS